eukprot:TRINITY_DN5796_c0_g1_i1.p1 TRINITY_DN5796_c0_g1~~TRINITY_DN5796_c0_g1_i1.p1  ORF type:complete len:453 (+),score=113.22 TRINITY_DN5796_c0_g1_i1:46-1404(+)
MANPAKPKELVPDTRSRSEWRSVVGKIAAPARFCNNLPEIPFDPKFLSRPLSSLRKHVMYSATTMDHAYKIPVLTEPDLGVCPNLVDPEAYRLSADGDSPVPSEADRLLIAMAEAGGITRKAHRTKSQGFAWMRKAEYTANEAFQMNPIAQYKSRSDNMASYSTRILMQDQDAEKTTEEKVRDIEATFDCPDLASLKKKNKPHLKAVKITPILPSSSEMWANMYTQLMFDEDPYKSFGYSEEAALKGYIKPFIQKMPGFRERAQEKIATEHVLGYLLPNKSEDAEADEHGQPYNWCRNYTCTNEPAEKVFVFTEEKDGVIGFNLVESKLTVHGSNNKTNTTDRVKMKQRIFKRAELEPRRKRQRVMMTDDEIRRAEQEDEDLYTREELEDQARQLEQMEAEKQEAAEAAEAARAQLDAAVSDAEDGTQKSAPPTAEDDDAQESELAAEPADV